MSTYTNVISVIWKTLTLSNSLEMANDGSNDFTLILTSGESQAAIITVNAYQAFTTFGIL